MESNLIYNKLENNQFSLFYKIVLLGDTGVGKTTLFNSIIVKYC